MLYEVITVLDLETQLDNMRYAEVENARLRQALGFYKDQPDQMIPCDVVSRNISGWWSTVRIGNCQLDPPIRNVDFDSIAIFDQTNSTAISGFRRCMANRQSGGSTGKATVA